MKADDGSIRRRQAGKRRRDRGGRGRPRLRRLRGERGDAPRAPRRGLGAREGARDGVQHRCRHPHGAGGGRGAVRRLGELSRGGLGPERAPISGTGASATSTRSTRTRSASSSTPTASASSMRARTSATTRTRSTDARSSSSRIARRSRSSTRRSTHLLRDEYRIAQATKASAETIGDLADRLGIDRAGLERTVDAFNAAVRPGEFDPARLDGKRTEGIEPPKSNWALPLDTPPFTGYAVTCGITFTFGGLRIDQRASARWRRAADSELYAAGELVGGLFWELRRRQRANGGVCVRANRGGNAARASSI